MFKRQYVRYLSFVVLFSWILFSGCSTKRGPLWSKPVEFPRAQGDIKGKKIIVSKFLSAARTVSTTGSANITTIMESASVQDISFIMASELQKLGIPAKAIIDAGRQDIGKDSLLLRGVVVGVPYVNTGTACINALFGVIGIGCILPSPVEWRYGSNIKYQLTLRENLYYKQGI